MAQDSRPHEAVRLRLAGFTRSQIKTALGLRSSKLLNNWLRGVPPPDWTARPNAKDDLRAEAIALRLQGKSYNEIRNILGVSKSSLSLWLRDVALIEEHKDVDNDQLIFRVHIHESADVDGAVRFWADVVGADPQEFRRTTLKRPQPEDREKEHRRRISRLPRCRRAKKQRPQSHDRRLVPSPRSRCY